MSQTMQAKDVTLRDLHTQFQLELTEDGQFFPEWQTHLPDLSEIDRQMLDRIKASFFDTIEYPPVLEDTVKMVVIAPLLSVAGFYLRPFHIKTETSIKISEMDDDAVIEGRIDILVLREQLWILVIESKRVSLSIEGGMAQLLTYLVANPHATQPIFGLITNGESFMFVKLWGQQYATSRVMHLRNPGNDLYDVLRILKKISQIQKESYS